MVFLERFDGIYIGKVSEMLVVVINHTELLLLLLLLLLLFLFIIYNYYAANIPCFGFFLQTYVFALSSSCILCFYLVSCSSCNFSTWKTVFHIFFFLENLSTFCNFIFSGCLFKSLFNILRTLT